MKAIFVAGTDTGVGKTVVTGCLARFFSQKGLRVITQKWVQTGAKKDISEDIDFHLKMMGKDRDDIRDYKNTVMPYVFNLSASPHLASRLERKNISSKKIKKSFGALSSCFDAVIVEGAGGVLVPIDSRHFLIDIAKDLKLPVLLVAENRLGAINQALLSIEALRARGMDVLGVIFNDLKKYDARILKDNPRIIKKLSGVRVFGTLPRGKSGEEIYRSFVPIAQKIQMRLKGTGPFSLI
ncbi:MAG TPA: dethiobiotin synthase [Candidatus Omnitrophica bacterium]|nr:dethiobiotin synthase [Candidatus Omnitrophota bacterium]